MSIMLQLRCADPAHAPLPARLAPVSAAVVDQSELGGDIPALGGGELDEVEHAGGDIASG